MLLYPEVTIKNTSKSYVEQFKSFLMVVTLSCFSIFVLFAYFNHIPKTIQKNYVYLIWKLYMIHRINIQTMWHHAYLSEKVPKFSKIVFLKT